MADLSWDELSVTNPTELSWDSLSDKPPESKARGWGGVAKDIGITALKSAISVPESAIGLADIVTGGHAGKVAEEIGFRPKEAKDILSQGYSDEQKKAFDQMQQAKGLWETTKAALSNPSVIAHTAGESIAPMLAGGVVGRGVAALGKLGSVSAGAIGEGVLGAGSFAEQVRQQTGDGLLTAEQSGLALGAGALTTAFGALGAKVAKSLGIADVDTMLIGAAKSDAVGKGVTRRMLEGALSEGLLEELPQSVSEQVLQNKALGKPLDEGIDQAIVLGTLSGGLMGGGAAALGSNKPATPPPAPTPDPLRIGNTPDPMIGFPDGTVARRSEVEAYINTLPEDQRVAARAKLQGLEKQPAKPDDILKTESADDAISTFMESVSKTGQDWQNLGVTPTGETSLLSSYRAGQEWQGIAPDQTGSLEQQRAEIEREGAALSQARDARLAEVGQQWQDLGITNPADDLQAQRMGMREEPNGVPPSVLPADSGRNGQDGNLTAESVGTGTTVDGPSGVQAGGLVDDSVGEFSKPSGEAPASAVTILQAELERTEPFTREHSDLIDQLQTAVSSDAQAAIDSGSMPVYATGNGNHVAIHPSAQNPGKIQVSRYAKDGIIGDSQYNSIEEAVRSEGLWQQPRLEAKAAEAVIGASAQAESQFQDRNVQNVPTAAGKETQTTPSETRTDAVSKPAAVDGVPPAGTGAAVQADGLGGFDSKAWDKAREDRIKASKKSGAVHLDDVTPAIEAMRGKVIQSAHDPKERGVVRTVDNRGNVYVQWSDEYSGQKNLASETEEPNKSWLKTGKSLPIWQKSASGRTLVLQTSLGPTDLKDYVFSNTIPQPTQPITGEGAGVAKPKDTRLIPVSKRTESANAQADQAQQSEPPAQTSQAEVIEPNFEAAKALIKQQKAATGNKSKENLVRIKLRQLAAKTPINHGKTVSALDIAATRLGMGEGKLKGLEFAPEEQPQAPVEPAQVATETVAKPRKKPAGGKTLRSKAYDKNPLLTFLATHGLFHDKTKPGSHKVEFSPDKAIMVMGYGPVFKKTGKRLDELTQNAIEEGYLPTDGTESQLRELVRRAVAGEKISPLYAEGVAEQIAEQNFAEHLAQQQEAAQNEEFDDPFEPMLDGDFVADDFDVPGYDEASDPIKLEVNALLALADDAGINEDAREAIKEDAHYATLDQSEQAYYEAYRNALKAAIAASNRVGSADSGEASNAQGQREASPPEISGSVSAVQSSQKALEAGQAEIDEAKGLKYKLPYLEDRLKENLDPTDGFDMHILANELPPNRAYNRMMTDHNGDFSGVEFKNKDGRHAFVLPDASQPGKWRVSYFDKDGFSRHESEPTREKAQQSLARDGYTIEDKGALDRLASTKEWARGTDFAGLIFQLNSGAITHAQFIEKQNKLNADYEASKGEGLTLTAPSRQEVLAQQAAIDAEAKRKEEGGDKPIPRKQLTGDIPDLFNPQGSVFDAPAEPEAVVDPISQSVQALADAVKGLQTALAPKVEGKQSFPITAQGAIDAFNADDSTQAVAIMAKLKLDDLKEVGGAIGFRPQNGENAKSFRERIGTVADKLTLTNRKQTSNEMKLHTRLTQLASDYDRAIAHRDRAIANGAEAGSSAFEGQYEGQWTTIDKGLEILENALREEAKSPDYAKVSAMVKDARPAIFDAAKPDNSVKPEARPDSGGILFSRTTNGTPTLIIQHNLTEENLLHADRMGGIPVPSLAITQAEHPLVNFGEITLVGGVDMANPKGYAATKVFGADIYSPRYPRVTFSFTANMKSRGEAMLKDALKATDSRIEWSEVATRGADELRSNPAIRWQVLTDNGLKPEIIRTEAKQLPKAMEPFANDNRHPHELAQDPAFIEAAYKAHEVDLVRMYDGDAKAAQEEIAQLKERANERGVSYLVRGYANDVQQHQRDTRSAGAIDRQATNRAMEVQIEEAGLRDKLEAYSKDYLRQVNPDEKLFQGLTNMGNRKYIPHTLDNVIKILKKDMVGGEGFNYGVGSVRSRFTPQFKSIAEIQKAKGRLMDEKAFDLVKEEVNNELSELSNALRSYHDASDRFGFGDTVTSTMYDSAKMGLSRALTENGFKDVPQEAKEQIAEFLGKLRNMPTAYFEAKILRAVDVSEFKGAVVPKNTSQKALDALARRGITNIKYYDKNIDGDRSAKIQELAKESDLLFSRGETQNPTTVSALQSAIKDLLGTFGTNKLGRIVATTAAEIKSTWEPLIGKTNLESEGNAGKAQAFFDPKTNTVFLIADNIEAGTETAVLAHELMHKHGKSVLGEAGWNKLHSVISSWANAKEGSQERQVYDQASAAVERVGVELSTEELFPYAVEAAIKMGIKPDMKGGAVARWLESVRQNLKMVWQKITNKPETFKAQDLVNLAFGIAQRENNPDLGAINEPMTDENIVGNQGGRSADDNSPGKFAMAGDMVDGLLVRDEIPNQGSIGSSIDDYTVLRGIREIPLTAFTQLPKLKYYSISEEARTKRLAEQIKASGEINPLIVVIDKEGPYVLEGGHRFDALREIGKTSFPALVVLDNESLNEPTAPDSGGAFSRGVDQTGAEANPDIRFSRTPTDDIGLAYPGMKPPSDGARLIDKQTAKPNPHSWDAPEPSQFDDLVYRLQDKQIDTKRVTQAIRELSGQLADEKDVYLQEELFHGRAAARTEDFVNKELGPLVMEMKMRGIDIPTLDEYLHARHAKEANAVLAERNPSQAMINTGRAKAAQEVTALAAKLDAATDKTQRSILQKALTNATKELNRWNIVVPYKGTEESRLMLSGMSDKAADSYFAKLDPAQRAKLEAVTKKVDAIIAGTRQLYVDYGLENQAVVDGWASLYKNYIPLMREDKDGGMGIGQGFSIKGKETKGRTGSTRKVVDILANIAMQRERAIVRGEKNHVATALVGLATANPNPEFWHTGPPPTERVYDPKTNSVVDRADPLYKSRENVVVAKVKQPSGEVKEVAVSFNEDNERAMRMAAALKNLDASQLNGVLGVSAKITRYFAAINTQYNPIFGTVNLVRDFQGALLNLSTTPLKNHKTEIAGHTLSALKGIYLDARAAREGKPQTSAWATIWEEFQAEGGQTGYRDMFASSNDRAKAIEHELNPTKWMDSPLGKVFTAGGALKVPLSIAQKKAAGLFNWLSDYNLAMENAVRLSAYKVGLEQGMSKQQAASLAKNLTVNFNRKGQVGQQAGALYAFFNASMQGSARLGKTLFDMDGQDVKSIRLSSTGKKIVYGGMLLGTMQALLLAAAGFDDEEPPDFVRERSLIIPTGGKSYITIPMPLGLHVLPNMGRIPTEFALGGFKQPAKHIAKLLGLTANAFNPVGGGASLVQMLSPTAIDPIVALAENKDWTGKPIAKTSYNKATPGHALVKDTASAPSKVLSEAINLMTGGTKYTAGVFSPTPDQIDYLWGQATGGVGRELSKVQQTASATITGEDLPVHKIPLVGRFYGNAETQSAQSSKFYATINRLNEHEAEIKGLQKDRKGAELSEYLAENPEARLFKMANAVELEVQKMRRMKREMLALGAPQERIKTLEERITARMTQFNQTVARLKTARETATAQ